jgi:hypothetical protein
MRNPKILNLMGNWRERSDDFLGGFLFEGVFVLGLIYCLRIYW